MSDPPLNGEALAGRLGLKSPHSTSSTITPLVCSAQGHCQHEETRIAIELPGSVHFAREVCRNCDRVLRWIAKPANVERQRLNGYRIAKLAMSEALNSWERRFISSVAQQRRLSPKQQAKLDQLCDKFQIGGRR